MDNLGYYHPAIVHFAIGLLAAGVLLRWASLTRRLAFAGPAALVLLVLGTAAAGTPRRPWPGCSWRRSPTARGRTGGRGGGGTRPACSKKRCAATRRTSGSSSWWRSRSSST